jgi:predicted acyltransferase
MSSPSPQQANYRPAGGPDAAVAAAPSPRLLSLDVFRGLNILVMIVVNCCGPGSFRQLQHSEWNGCTLTDLVFPFFLFISGVSIAFSSRLQSDQAAQPTTRGLVHCAPNPARSRLRLLPAIVRRAAAIFAIGLLINAYPHFRLATWRIPGVLQRIAICYLAASLLYLFAGARTRWVVIGTLLVGYWILLRYVPVPGYGVPTVAVPLLDPNRNLVAWLDRRLMMGHLYEQVRDPEGLLSTLPALANMLFGLAAGEWLRRLRSHPSRLLRRLIVMGAACLAAAAVWAPAFPINKKLWTSSYVLLTTGLAMLVLALCYWLLDIKALRGRWMVLPAVFGTNCIFAYALSEFLAITLVVAKVKVSGQWMSYKQAFNYFTFENLPSTQWSELGYALFYVALCWAVTWLLYRRRIFLKL